ncbi:hypothetical protein O7621_07135 [Solwaraspora sp. WMMD937]|uniref:hypothetical protein n=1 Tax=Solwaraspora sp. WMMD937 TaxID=3016090 RepID=UPI00249C27BF|nr:hypothetical protein [Solwaraspora sp. WMMD937]WFE23085.1 hypothetical protein O7621_07135 [Solwaraspora sp. WMMD937]
MMRDGYVARWQGQEYDASPAGDEVRIYQPTEGEGFIEIRSGRYVRVVPMSEVDDLAYVRTTCTWHGQPFVVLAKHDGWLRVEYTGGRAPVAQSLGLEEFDFGVYQGWAAANEVTELREHRV